MVKNIYEFAKRIGKGLKSAQSDPANKRQIIEDLDVWVTFAVEDGEKVLYVRCVLDDNPEKLGVPSTTTP